MDSEQRDKAFEDLYRFPLKDGKHIQAEICSCGHSRYDHADTFSIGHGHCETFQCSCPQFTWVSWVTA